MHVSYPSFPFRSESENLRPTSYSYPCLINSHQHPIASSPGSLVTVDQFCHYTFLQESPGRCYRLTGSSVIEMAQEICQDELRLLKCVLPHLHSVIIVSGWMPERDLAIRAFWAELIPHLHTLEAFLNSGKPAWDLAPIGPALEHLQELIDTSSSATLPSVSVVCLPELKRSN